MQDFADFLKVLFALTLLAAAVALGFAGGGFLGALGGVVVWWLLAAVADS